MACSAKICKMSGPSELYVRCWICEDEYHGKCVGLSNSFTVGLRDSSYNSRWSCDLCVKKTIEFSKLFKQCRSVFLDINKDLAGLQNKLSRYEDAFKAFSVLNSSADSPPRKKILRSNSKSVPNVQISNQLQVPINEIEPMCTDTDELSSVPSTSASALSIAPASVLPIVPASALPIAAATALPNAPAINLVAVAPKKTVFLSRLAADTSENDIITYIKSKIKPTADTVVKKFNFSNPRITSSFKVFVSEDLFDTVVNPSFWPQNTLVKEFVYRNKKNSNIASIPKN